jgi:type VI secretion system secreted protein Hcp
MVQFKRSSRTALITAITFILPWIVLNVETAQGKENSPVPKIKLRVEITGISGDGPGGTIEAFGSDQLIEFSECVSCGGGGKVVFGPLVITKDVDSASPKLLFDVETGSHIQQVRIDWIRKNPVTGADQVYFTTILEDVVVVSFRTRVADQRDPLSLQGGTVEDVGLKAKTTQFFYLQPDGTFINSRNITPSAGGNN